LAAAENSFTIIVDTRDKPEHRWEFKDFLEDKEVRDVVFQKLDYGDYSIAGLEDTFCIERKASVEEIINNITKDKKRFKAELEEMRKFKYPFLICEFEFREILNGSRFSKITPSYIISVLLEIEIKYGIPVHFVGGNSELFAYKIMRKVWNIENNKERW